MKNVFTILLLALAMTTMAQKPRIAVYVTGEDPINEIIANRLMAGFINSGKYMPVERSAAFLAAVNNEHSYERTGEVDDEQIAQLGMQFGIQYICVVSVLEVWENEKYITSRILDVTSAEVIGSCSSNGSISTGGALMSALDDLTEKLNKALEYSKNGATKRVAVYVTKTGNRDVDIILGDQLVAGFARSGEYVAVERTNAFLKQINKESGYQQSGAVNDADLLRLGKKFGVQYVCVAQTIPWGGTYFISSRLVDVETAEVSKMYNAENKVMKSSSDVLSVAIEIAENLSAISKEDIVPQDYVEDAWDINMKMIWVEGGEFMMGCTKEQGADCENDELNVRRVRVDGFYIGMLEVTQSQWEKVMGTSIQQQWNKAGNTDYLYSGKGNDYPIYCVNWNEAMEFCKQLSNKTGKSYTLPTEAQWEYAARGGNKGEGYKFAGHNSPYGIAYWNRFGPGLCGTLLPNEIGIYDMSGNVYEWCKDWFVQPYLNNDVINPVGPTSGANRVRRGGGWNSKDSKYCRVANRGYADPKNRRNDVGFRVVCLP